MVNGSADCELRRSKKTARNEGWRRYSGNNSPSSGSSDNRYFPTATEVKQFSTFDTSIVIRMGILVIMNK